MERVPKGEIKITDELIDIGALDDGRWKALLIREPGDPRNLKGYVHIPREIAGATWRSNCDPIGLAELFFRYTGIEIKIDPVVFLNSPNVKKYPFVYLPMENYFQLTKYEAQAFREYIEGGGFVVLIASGLRDPVCDRPIAALSIMQMLRDVFGDNFRRTLALADFADMNRVLDEGMNRPIQLQYIPNDHELYRCFLHIDLVGQQKIPITDEKCQKQPPTHMEGIWRNRRLILVYSENPEVHKRLVLNMLVYALTQPGGKTQHLVDASTVTSQKSRKFWDYKSRVQFRDEEKSLFNPKYQPKTP
ncbi:MAG: DUF4159 domain-containing protein [Candidatus Latescibacterota bacterium]